MNSLFRFDPHSENFKTPFGAVKCGTEISFSAKAMRDWAYNIELLVFEENTGNDKAFQMVWIDREKDLDIYSCKYQTENASGIFWYCFKVTTTDGTVAYCGKNGIKYNIDEVSRYQLTVFSKDYVTPSWFSEGVTYHIFVDRFFRATKDDEQIEDDFFIVHKDKDDTPIYRPNTNGVVENRDIYGGNLAGIEEKLPYLESLGVKTIYLSPIFEAWSNHKYNTADYKKIDSHFGDEKDLKSLCASAKKRGMRVILDGVFSHTGSDSIYFNREGRYGNGGAYRDVKSEYREWFDFYADGKYSSWWGIDTLPQVNELNSAYQNYIIEDEDSVIAHWMDIGVSGWRLDVADELPDEFIRKLKARARKEKSDALVIGEVWEDASTKKAYGVNKTYFTDGVLDGVMNYPLKNAILRFLRGEGTAKDFCRELNALLENYPDISQRCLMNIIGTHDTVRAINELSVGSLSSLSKDERAERKLTDAELKAGRLKLRQAAVMQYMFPGSPCVYYGDEIGMQGFEDPFNRRFFSWNNIDNDLLEFYQKLGALKNNYDCMKNGKFKVGHINSDVVILSRMVSSQKGIFAFVNRADKCCFLKVPKNYKIIISLGENVCKNGVLKLGSFSACIIVPRVNISAKKAKNKNIKKSENFS